MTIYVLISDSPKTPDAVKKLYVERLRLGLGGGRWLLADTGTAKEIFEKLGGETVPLDGTIVFPTNGFWGRHNAETWDWIRARLKENGG